MNKIIKNLKIKFFWITFERFPNLFRPSSKPFVSGDTFRAFSDHIFDECKTFDPLKVQDSQIVFVNTDVLKIYFKTTHPKIKNKYILISHNSDLSITKEMEEFIDEKIIHWYGQNLTFNENNKISPLPIGLENRRRLKHGRLKWFKNKEINKNKLILCSFNELTNFNLRGKIQSVLNNEFIVYQKYETTKEYFENLKNFKYVICPSGNGPDTHRIWEGLLLECLPILKIDDFTFNLKKIGVPGLYIQEWEDLNHITKEYLEDYYEKFTSKEYKKLTRFKYWENQINSKII